MLKDRIQSDLKAAMLSGDRSRVDALNMIKSAILNEEIAQHKRDTGLSDDEVLALLAKESKKRLDAAEMYSQAGNHDKATAEQAEAALIQAYLPEQMSEEEIVSLIDNALSSLDHEPTQKDMGVLIGSVKSRAGASADGATIARLVSQKIKK